MSIPGRPEGGSVFTHEQKEREREERERERENTVFQAVTGHLSEGDT